MNIVDDLSPSDKLKQHPNYQELWVVKVVDISPLVQGQVESPPSEAEDAGEAIARLGQSYNPYPIYNFIPVILGDQGNIITRPHQRLRLLVEDAGVEWRMDGGNNTDFCLQTFHLTHFAFQLGFLPYLSLGNAIILCSRKIHG